MGYGGSCDCGVDGVPGFTDKTVKKKCTVDENPKMCSAITIFKKCKDATVPETGKCLTISTLNTEKKAKRCVKAKKYCPNACGACDGGGGSGGGGGGGGRCGGGGGGGGDGDGDGDGEGGGGGGGGKGGGGGG